MVAGCLQWIRQCIARLPTQINNEKNGEEPCSSSAITLVREGAPIKKIKKREKKKNEEEGAVALIGSCWVHNLSVWKKV